MGKGVTHTTVQKSWIVSHSSQKIRSHLGNTKCSVNWIIVLQSVVTMHKSSTSLTKV